MVPVLSYQTAVEQQRFVDEVLLPVMAPVPEVQVKQVLMALVLVEQVLH